MGERTKAFCTRHIDFSIPFASGAMAEKRILCNGKFQRNVSILKKKL